MVKKNDFILIGILLFVSICLLIVIKLFKKPGEYAFVYVDGSPVRSISLKDDYAEEVKTKWGYNLITVKDGSVSVTDADCPDKVCQKMGAIDDNGESIVCVPHKLVVEIKGESSEYDGK